jgi:hypothetical protein
MVKANVGPANRWTPDASGCVWLVKVDLNQHRDFKVCQHQFVAESKQLLDAFLTHEKLRPHVGPAIERRPDKRTDEKARTVVRSPKSVLRGIEHQCSGIPTAGDADLLRRRHGRHQHGRESQRAWQYQTWFHVGPSVLRCIVSGFASLSSYGLIAATKRVAAHGPNAHQKRIPSDRLSVILAPHDTDPHAASSSESNSDSDASPLFRHKRSHGKGRSRVLNRSAIEDLLVRP